MFSCSDNQSQKKSVVCMNAINQIFKPVMTTDPDEWVLSHLIQRYIFKVLYFINLELNIN